MKKLFKFINNGNIAILSFLLLLINPLMITSLSDITNFTYLENNNDYIELNVPPNVTDPMIDSQLFDNYVVLNNSVPAKNILWVHFPGATLAPSAYSLFIKEAADQGYHSIGLTWENIYSLNLNCISDPDLACYDYIRLEIFDGINRTHKCDVSDNPANSILNRLIKLLIYLNEQSPSDGWDQYLDSEGQPEWAKIAFSGHSFGGGQAGIIGQMYSVARVVFFASPEDWNAMQDEHANWMNETFATSSDRMYGFIHTMDDFYWHNYAPKNWYKMGLGNHGNLVSVDYIDPPYMNSHQLITSARGFGFNPRFLPHQGVIMDQFLNLLIDGSNRYLPVWRYLLSNVTANDNGNLTNEGNANWSYLPFFLVISFMVVIVIRNHKKYIN
ncbi:MAG: BPSS1187 family protein [Candidatus Hodarchaeales archaeon]|jgi:hypothetical protein